MKKISFKVPVIFPQQVSFEFLLFALAITYCYIYNERLTMYFFLFFTFICFIMRFDIILSDVKNMENIPYTFFLSAIQFIFMLKSLKFVYIIIKSIFKKENILDNLKKNYISRESSQFIKSPTNKEWDSFLQSIIKSYIVILNKNIIRKSDYEYDCEYVFLLNNIYYKKKYKQRKIKKNKK